MNEHVAQAMPVPVDPARDDLPHPDCSVERWCLNARVRTAEGDERILCVLFMCHRPVVERPSPAHSLIWSHTRPATSGYAFESWLDGAAFAAARSMFESGGAWDPHVRRAALEALDGGRPLLPDRLLEAPVRMASDRLDLDFGGVAALRRQPSGAYDLTVTGQEESFELTVEPCKPPLPLGDDGTVPFGWSPGESPGESPGSLRSYCMPRMAARGSLTVPGQSPVQVTGEASLEHSFGSVTRLARRAGDLESSRLWMHVQLDNGWDVTAARTSLVEDLSGAESPEARPVAGDDEPDQPMATHATRSDHTVCSAASPDGRHRPVTGDLRTTRHWTSSITMNSYPVGIRLRIPELDLDVHLAASLPEQEVQTMVVERACWKGHCHVEGTMGGLPVRGHAFVEFTPPNVISDLEDFMRRVGRATRAEVRLLYPDTPEPAVMQALAGLEGHAPLDDVSNAQLHSQLVAPVRHVTDLGGKTWRTFASACIMALFFQRMDRCRSLMAVTELLHSGSLIVDDVEDASPLRRGGPAAHEVFGEPTAINAGTAAYFVFDRVLDDALPDTPVLRLRVLRAFLRTLRAAHAGQALDIAGHTRAMDDAVTTGDTSRLLQQLHATHRLKSGLPVRMFAETSALLAGAGEDQIAAIGAYFEAVGVAYQISDDVADLHGVGTIKQQGRRRTAKRVAEDLLNGKVTVPLAHSVPLLPPERRRALWEAVRDGRATASTVASVACEITECGAVDAARAHARHLLDEAWPAVDAALPPSMAKANLRSLGWYAVQREDDVPDRPGTAGLPPNPRRPLPTTHAGAPAAL
ncbi:polyprenyl synthetase family protein [Streptomyces cinnamoneus]|uniref:polyprenyl synthetase family protein n=1 Tax=Streptomyces cinnamoneus TaxID=53446 RepID=UPI0034295068